MVPQLSAIKVALFALLAALFIVLCGAVYTKMSESKFCGTEPIPVCGTKPAYLNEQQSRGKELFLYNCASCHNKNMKDNLTGPALGPAVQAWEKYPRKDLYRFIRNSQGMIQKGHPRALQTWKEFEPTIMVSFPALTDEDIEALLTYIKRLS